MLARGLVDELKAAKGSVVNVTSIAGSRVHPFAGAAYATSKAALASLTREMASRLRPARHPRQRHRAGRDRHRDSVARHRQDRRADSAAAARHARRGGQDHLRAVHGDEFLRERRRDPHQRRAARLVRRIPLARDPVSSVVPAKAWTQLLHVSAGFPPSRGLTGCRCGRAPSPVFFPAPGTPSSAFVPEGAERRETRGLGASPRAAGEAARHAWRGASPPWRRRRASRRSTAAISVPGAVLPGADGGACAVARSGQLRRPSSAPRPAIEGSAPSYATA